ncbi:hypothetical protein SAMN02745174_00953 [Cetobacterium ceti]|uniref:Membrane protein involved in the export of O-antigen and teichoic acid n=1 Tax=Cetobacterium ceti TaxID=180163 RepID=A0A1T4LTG7_9FUSO|nr:hypothetical protein SAMN02745174_00953 [Cetobacterium ceti]
MPIILNFLNPTELGIWYILMGLNIIANILECGFQPVVIRYIAYYLSLKEENEKENILNLLGSIKQIYKNLSKILFIILIVFGSFYLKDILIQNFKIKIIWIIYIITLTYQLSFSYLISILNGYGKIASSNKTIAYSKILSNMLMLSFLILRLNLLGLVCANLLGVFILRYLLYREIKYLNITKLLENKNYKGKICKKLYREAFKMGIVSISQFLNTKYIFFLFGRYFSLEIIARYGVTIQLFELLTKLSRLPIDIYIAKLSQMIYKEKYKKAFDYYKFILVIIIFIYIVGGSILIKYGNIVLEIVGKNQLLETKILFFLYFYYLIEIIYGVSTYFLTTFKFLDFYKSFFISGIFCSVAATLGMIYFEFDMLDVIKIQIISQLLYNFWKWPLEIYRRYLKYEKNR